MDTVRHNLIGPGIVLIILALAHVPGIRPAGAEHIVLQSDLGGTMQLVHGYIYTAEAGGSPVCQPRDCLYRALAYTEAVLEAHPNHYIAWTVRGNVLLMLEELE